MMMRCAAVVLLLGAARGQTGTGREYSNPDGSCMSGNVLNVDKPAGYDEYLAKFKRSYSTNHKLTAAEQSNAEPSSAEIADAQKIRNQLRSIPRDKTMGTPRFCGLDYETGPGGFNCAPENALDYDAEFFSKCYNVDPAAGEECGDDITDYAQSIAAAAVVPIALAAVFQVLYLIWYLLRCCKLAGGRKPGGHSPAEGSSASAIQKCCGWLCPACSKGPGEQKHPFYTKCNRHIFQAIFVLAFVLALAAGLVGLMGNSNLDDGLPGFVDGMMYELGTTVDTFTTIVNEMNEIQGNSTSADQAKDMDEFRCFVADAQADVQEDAPEAFDLRSLATLVVCAIPIVVTALALFGGLVKVPALPCCAAVMIFWLMLIVGLSTGLHGVLGVMMGDLCTEIDLVLHYPKGSRVNAAFMPDGILPCGADGQFAELERSIEELAEEVLKVGGDLIRDFCNGANNSQTGQDFSTLYTTISETIQDPTTGLSTAVNASLTINCSAAAGPNKLLNGTYPSYVEGSYTLANFADAKHQIVVGDPGVQNNTCKDSETYNAANKTCPNPDQNDDCVPHYSWFVSNNETLRTLQECGDMASGGCEYPELAKLSCAIVDGLDQLQTLKSFTDLFENEIRPLLRCEFLKDIFSSIYMPLCVDSMNGFALLTISNSLGFVLMVLFFPVYVMSTKRLKKDNSVAADDIKPQGP